jgi:CBS domain-containing protein
VSQFVTLGQRLLTLNPEESLVQVIHRLSETDCTVLPVVDKNNRLLGVVSLEEAHLASQSPNLLTIIVAADLMRSDITPLQLNDRLDRAVELFVENDLAVLPVVDELGERRVLGIVKRAEIAGAYLRHVHGTSEGTETSAPLS